MAGSRRKKGHRENSGYDRNIAAIIPSPGSPPTEIPDAKKLDERGERFRGDPRERRSAGNCWAAYFKEFARDLESA
jgi:hypothetical protein